MKLLIIDLAGLAFACFYINFIVARAVKELRQINLNVSACRVFLTYIVENMPRGERISVQDLAMRENLEKIFGKRQ